MSSEATVLGIDEAERVLEQMTRPPPVEYGRLRCPSFTIPRIALHEWRDAPQYVRRTYGVTEVMEYDG